MLAAVVVGVFSGRGLPSSGAYRGGRRVAGRDFQAGFSRLKHLIFRCTDCLLSSSHNLTSFFYFHLICKKIKGTKRLQKE